MPRINYIFIQIFYVFRPNNPTLSNDIVELYETPPMYSMNSTQLKKKTKWNMYRLLLLATLSMNEEGTFAIVIIFFSRIIRQIFQKSVYVNEIRIEF